MNVMWITSMGFAGFLVLVNIALVCLNVATLLKLRNMQALFRKYLFSLKTRDTHGP